MIDFSKMGILIYEKLTKTFKIDDEQYTILKVLKEMDPFKLLIATILSQNTNDKNSIRAYDRLEEKIGIYPHKLARADIKDIEGAIRIGGLYRQKARAIKEISRIILDNYEGDLNHILKKPIEDARRTLLSLPKIGYKTADVLLLFSAGKSVFPIDTHITRISKRLGIVNERARYEEIRLKWQEILKPEHYELIHLLLIKLGREICKPRKPSCEKCPIKEVCKYYSNQAASTFPIR